MYTRTITYIPILLLLPLSAFCEVNKTYLKVETGYVKTYKFFDKNRTKNSKLSHIDAAAPSTKRLLSAELGYQVTDYLRLGVAFQHIDMKLSRIDIDRDNARVDFGPKANFVGVAIPYFDSSIKVRSTALIFNGYYDFNKLNNFQPYIVVGTGIVKNKTSNYLLNIDQYHFNRSISIEGSLRNNIAYNVGVGGRFNASDNIFLDLGLKYFNYGYANTKPIMTRDFPNDKGAIKFKIHGMMATVGISVLLG